MKLLLVPIEPPDTARCGFHIGVHIKRMGGALHVADNGPVRVVASALETTGVPAAIPASARHRGGDTASVKARRRLPDDVFVGRGISLFWVEKRRRQAPPRHAAFPIHAVTDFRPQLRSRRRVCGIGQWRALGVLAKAPATIVQPWLRVGVDCRL